MLNGGMLLSKRQEQFLPGKWPVFLKKQKKMFCIGVNNKKYSNRKTLMGVGKIFLVIQTAKLIEN